MKKMEEWKAIRESKHKIYHVSSHGRVRSAWKSNPSEFKILKKNLCPISEGVNRVRVHIGGGYSEYVHRLVAEAFLENPNNYEEVDHIDGNPENNMIENLRYANRFIQTANRKVIQGKETPKGVVYIADRNKWRACWRENGESKSRTTFETMEEALEFRREMVKQHYVPEYIEAR
jgi:hypothetical protein